MRLVELFLKEQTERKFTVSVWIDYAAHRGDLPPDQFANRAEWLEDRLAEIADMCDMAETGGGGWIGEFGGSRDVSYSSESVDLETALHIAKNAESELSKFKEELENTSAKLGIESNFNFDASITLNLKDPVHGEIALCGDNEIDDLIAGRVTVEQLIDNASEGLGESV